MEINFSFICGIFHWRVNFRSEQLKRASEYINSLCWTHFLCCWSEIYGKKSRKTSYHMQDMNGMSEFVFDVRSPQRRNSIVKIVSHDALQLSLSTTICVSFCSFCCFPRTNWHDDIWRKYFTSSLKHRSRSSHLNGIERNDARCQQNYTASITLLTIHLMFDECVKCSEAVTSHYRYWAFPMDLPFVCARTKWQSQFISVSIEWLFDKFVVCWSNCARWFRLVHGINLRYVIDIIFDLHMLFTHPHTQHTQTLVISHSAHCTICANLSCAFAPVATDKDIQYPETMPLCSRIAFGIEIDDTECEECILAKTSPRSYDSALEGVVQSFYILFCFPFRALSPCHFDCVILRSFYAPLESCTHSFEHIPDIFTHLYLWTDFVAVVVHKNNIHPLYRLRHRN